jgi:hypothetical protein
LTLISFLLNTKLHRLYWKIIWQILFCFIYPSLKFTFLKHKNSEFWNNLWDVIRFNQFLSMRTSTIINNMNEYLMKHEHKILRDINGIHCRNMSVEEFIFCILKRCLFVEKFWTPTSFFIFFFHDTFQRRFFEFRYFLYYLFCVDIYLY